MNLLPKHLSVHDSNKYKFVLMQHMVVELTAILAVSLQLASPIRANLTCGSNLIYYVDGTIHLNGSFYIPLRRVIRIQQEVKHSKKMP